jgi:hypothetical protein
VRARGGNVQRRHESGRKVEGERGSMGRLRCHEAASRPCGSVGGAPGPDAATATAVAIAAATASAVFAATAGATATDVVTATATMFLYSGSQYCF